MDFVEAVDRAAQRCRDAGIGPGSVVITPGAASFESLVWFLGAALLGAVVVPLRPEREGEKDSWAGSCRIDWQINGDRIVAMDRGTTSPAAQGLLDELRIRGHPGLILGTGGTTGTPKLVLHDLAALLAAIPVKTGRPGRTLPLMKFDHIGGLDMAWRALAGTQVLVAPPPEITPDSVAATVARHAVEILPATPSFLNLLLLAGADRTHDLGSLRLVPYGAEPMPSGLLARLRTALPWVEFVPRFGTSETGALPVRQSGDGLVLATKNDGSFAWKIVDDELWVRSPARALGYLSGDPGGLVDGGWFRTGDYAEQRADGAIRILGRRRDVINVGGEKVLPDEIENWLLSHPLVADCRVFALPNALLGQIVAAEVVWRGPERDAVAVKRLLHASAGSSPDCYLPTVVRLVKSVDTTGNLKKIRPSAQ
jgi:acyl-CoA synthetase (AMP-forming)/AMP-acid ligase II